MFIRLGANSLGELSLVNMLSCLRSLFRPERHIAMCHVTLNL